MPSDNPTPAENAVLILLMAEGGEASNRQLNEKYGVSLTGASRTKLERLKYVESWKVGNAYSFRLIDAGWAQCGGPLNVMNTRSRTLSAALSSLLFAVHRDLERTNRSLAMVFAPTIVGRSAEHAGEAAGEPSADVVGQIRMAYRQLVNEPGAWVSIADIRDELPHESATTIDEALRTLEQQADVNIVPQANEKALSERTRRAAVIIGNESKHFIVIGV